MNKKIATVFSFFLALLSFQALAASDSNVSSNPYKLIQKIADDTFSHLKANQRTYQASPDLLKKVAKKDILPHINVRYAALRVLGPLARKTTVAQRNEFTEAFTEYLITSYAQILIQYTDQKVTVEQEKPIDEKRNIVSVRVNMIDNNRPPVKFDFKLRKNKATGEWQGYDVQVEGVSMLDTKASEWQADLRKNGVSYVAKQLRELAKAPIKQEDSKS